MKPDMIDRLLNSIASAGRVSEIDDIDPCPDEHSTDVCITCPSCGCYHSIYTLCEYVTGSKPQSVGCAFGGGNSADTEQLELDEIPMKDAVATCHRLAEKMRMYE